MSWQLAKKGNECAVLRYYHNRLPSQNILIKDRRAQSRFFCCCEYCHDAAGVEFIYVVCVFLFAHSLARTRWCILSRWLFASFLLRRSVCVCTPYFWPCFNERLVQIKRVARAFVPFNCDPLMRERDLAAAPPLSPLAARNENFSTVEKK